MLVSHCTVQNSNRLVGGAPNHCTLLNPGQLIKPAPMKSVAHIFGDRFGTRLDVKLFIDAFEIGADGINADSQLIGNLLIGYPLFPLPKRDD
jgi:hypothetical protein